jgi:fucose 4-O-acetylase-like acetyltransferase
MALFFFIAGYVFNLPKYADRSYTFVRTRVKTLLIPFAFFSVLGLIFFSFLNEQNLFLSQPVLPFLKDVALAQDPGQPANWLWFLLSLFIVEMMYYALSRVLYPRRFLLQVILLVTVSLVGVFLIHINPLMALLYYGFGHLFRHHGEQNIRRALPVAVFVCTIPLLFLGGRNPEGMWNPVTLLQYVDMTGTAFLGIFTTVLMVMWAYEGEKRYRTMEFFGRNSITFYIMSGFVLAAYSHFFPAEIRYANILFLFATVLVGCLPFVVIFNRFIPFAIGRDR